MTPNEAEEKYGKELYKKMEAYLTGITVTVLPNGQIDIPREDIERAYKSVHSQLPNNMEWD